jgi:hypothetical protein
MLPRRGRISTGIASKILSTDVTAAENNEANTTVGIGKKRQVFSVSHIR